MILSDGPEEEGVARSTPATDFVDALLDQMVEDNLLAMAVRSSEPLPVPRGFLESVGYAAVTNRLKIMCDLNPVNFGKPVSGRFSRIGRMGKVSVHVDFHEAELEPCFEVRVEKLSS